MGHFIGGYLQGDALASPREQNYAILLMPGDSRLWESPKEADIV